MRFNDFIYKVNHLIDLYPKSKNGHPYLVLGNGKKIFFDRFVKKYGIDGGDTEYSEKDLRRRLSLVEFFKYFLADNFELVPGREVGKLIFESYFHRMVILEKRVGQSIKLELLSFYPLI